jgi:NADH dehydrogenase
MRSVTVIGATGYVGSHFVRAARRAGWRVVAASRHASAHADAWVRYDLRAPAPVLDGTATPIVHLAVLASESDERDVELAAAQALLDEARSLGTFVLFASSQVARAGAPTSYGRTKHAIEERVLASGGIVVRPGLVYGGAPGGLYATLQRAARRAVMLPAVVPAPCVQPVHVDDLAAALLRVLESPQRWFGHVLCVAEPEPRPFSAWMQELAAAFGRVPWRVPVPAAVVRAGAALADFAGARSLADRARSLLAIPPMATAGDLAALGVALRPSREDFARRAARRACVREGAALLRYVLGAAPGLALVRRYARAVEALRDALPLPLPGWGLRIPFLLRALDQPRLRAADAEWQWRVHTATAIAEASPRGAPRFLALQGEASRTWCIAAALAALPAEALARVASLVLGTSRSRG